MSARRRPPAARSPGRRPSAAVEWFAAGAVLLVGALVRLWILRRTSGLTMDSPLYVTMAEGLGQIATPLGPAHHGYPALVAVASLLDPGREWPGRMVSLASGWLLILVTFRLARGFLPTWGAALAALLVALHPLLALSSGTVMTEASFQMLTYAALLALEVGRTIPAAALMGVAYWVRPEALVIAIAALPALRPARRRLVWSVTFVLAMLPEVAYLSAERGTFTLTPKTNLVAASGAAQDDAEWRVSDADSSPGATRRTPAEWIRRELPAAAARYPDRLLGQLARVHQTWPLPLMALSVAGACLRPGVLLAPLAILPVLPMLGVTPHLRYPQTLVPALAVYAAIGAAWCLTRLGQRGRVARIAAAGGLVLAIAGGLLWCWRGPAGGAVRRSEDAPIHSLRKAGRWLAVHGRPGALVMDRKPYLPFFAGMRHALMPDDDYDTIVDHATRTGVDYLVMTEHVMWTMRRQFVPLMTDSLFRSREGRLRMIYGATDGPMTGVAIFEVVRGR